MASCVVLGLLWIFILMQASRGEELSHGVVLSWFREKVLEGLGLDEPPGTRREGDTVQPELLHQRGQRARRSTREDQRTRSDQDSSEMILFPSSDSSCDSFTYGFHSSVNVQDSALTSAHFWFYAGQRASNASASLFIVNAGQRLHAADAPSAFDSDGWTTYHLDGRLLDHMANGHFLFEVLCASCCCHTDEDKTPFLHLRVHRRSPVRLPRSAAVPWSPSAVHLLQRPSQGEPVRRDCHRAEVDVSFEELGWGSWIVHPKVLTFRYCHGNCSAEDGAASPLDGITRCCAPVPGSMKSLKITTTSDGGFSFKYETLPNIIPEQCACI